jgi:hypothetical protein
MHHRPLHAPRVFHLDLARVGQIGFLADEERVQLGAHEYRPPRPVSEHGEDSMAANVLKEDG